jgi:hypothetical protein
VPRRFDRSRLSRFLLDHRVILARSETVILFLEDEWLVVAIERAGGSVLLYRCGPMLLLEVSHRILQFLQILA